MPLTEYVIMPTSDYVAACDAIREKTGKTDPIKSGDLAAEIEGIPSGGGSNDEFPADRYFEGGYAEVNLPNATKIKQYAFYNDTVITTINMPKVTEIGLSAFWKCSKLALTELPSGITKIENHAFNSTKLVLDKLPDELTSIGDSAFYSVTGMNLTTLPGGITTIGGNAFFGCSNLALKFLPHKITDIQVSTFYNCKNITVPFIPYGVKQISSNAFYNCKGITSIRFKGTPTSINSNAFYGCTNLTTINVPWAEGAVANAPWGATNATINYNCEPVVESDNTIIFKLSPFDTEYTAREGMSWLEFVYSEYNDGSFVMSGSVIRRNGFLVGNGAESEPVNVLDIIEENRTYWNGNA